MKQKFIIHIISIAAMIALMTYLYLLMFASLDRTIFPEAQDVISAIIAAIDII